MLNRNDLAKQFELATKQEIVNHNAQILQTNSTLEGFKNELDLFSKALDKATGDLMSQIKQLAITDEALYRQIYSRDKDIANQFLELEERLKKSEMRSLQNASLISERLSQVEKLTSVIGQHSLSIDQLSKTVEFNRTGLRGEIFRCGAKAELDLKNFKIALESKPNEAAQVKQELASKIEGHRVDEQGILREMQKIKFSHITIKKNIEALYTMCKKLDEQMEALCPRQE